MDGSVGNHPHSKGHGCNFSIATSSTTSGDECINIGQDHLLPIANVGRIMKQALPSNAKVSKRAKETMQECASEFISFVTGEASDRCRKEKRKTIGGDDICRAMKTLGLDEYAEAMERYLHIYREQEEKARSNKQKSIQIDVRDELSFFRNARSRQQQLLARPLKDSEFGKAKRFL